MRLFGQRRRRADDIHDGGDRRTVVVAADSVAATRGEANEVLSGWGQHLGDALGGAVDVVNTASDSCTARWYFRNRLPGVLDRLSPGDVFLIGFGVCDQALTRPDLYLTPEEFRAHLHAYVDVLTARGVVPVLTTQVARHVFDEHDELRAVAGDYSVHTRRVAAERGVPLLDLQRSTSRLFDACGPELARGYFRWYDAGEHPACPDGIVDTLHLNRNGAQAVAYLAARGLRRLGVLPASVPPPADRPAPPRTVRWSRNVLAARWPKWEAGPEVHPAPVVETPTGVRPAPPAPRFTGTAGPGVERVLFLVDGAVLGSTGVAADGRWCWRGVRGWAQGRHTVEAVAVSDRGRSRPAQVRFRVRFAVPSPVVTAPAPRSLNGPSPVFKGTAAQGVRTVAAFCEGRPLGRAEVADDGSWRFRLPHDWLPGTHRISFAAVGSGGGSEPATLVFDVLAPDASSWLRRDPVSWHHCAPGGDCPHISRAKPPGAKNLLE
ncbi:GDSL-type esterase/lipase family protein [Streptomyces sp. NPDC050504]|uniref:GDSL-type esterase/lipase family protein n=1 Tax=Streptomyces sp. NPDC050504 TaxID=3365618 RepID=UPI0037AA8A6A